MDSPAGSGPRGPVVLIVEGDPHVRDLARVFLEAAGYRVEFEADGATALDRVRELRPSLVITEVLVPGLDGIELCRRIKEDRRLEATGVLIFSTVYAPLRARSAGADGFLSKPVERQRLLAAASRALGPSAVLRPEEGT